MVSAEFLDYQQEIGNDLSTPIPQYGFAGLVPGDRWCVTARNWLRAHEAGVAAYVVLAATQKPSSDETWMMRPDRRAIIPGTTF